MNLVDYFLLFSHSVMISLLMCYYSFLRLVHLHQNIIFLVIRRLIIKHSQFMIFRFLTTFHPYYLNWNQTIVYIINIKIKRCPQVWESFVFAFSPYVRVVKLKPHIQVDSIKHVNKKSAEEVDMQFSGTLCKNAFIDPHLVFSQFVVNILDVNTLQHFQYYFNGNYIS